MHVPRVPSRTGVVPETPVCVLAGWTMIRVSRGNAGKPPGRGNTDVPLHVIGCPGTCWVANSLRPKPPTDGMLTKPSYVSKLPRLAGGGRSTADIVAERLFVSICLASATPIALDGTWGVGSSIIQHGSFAGTAPGTHSTSPGKILFGFVM
jgi:hypothetical protein